AERDDPLFSCQGPFQMLLALNGNRGTNPFLGAMKGTGSLINALGEVSPGPPHYDLSLLQGGEFLPHSQGQILLHPSLVFPQNNEGQPSSQGNHAAKHGPRN